MNAIVLKNGATELEPLVVATMSSLWSLMRTQPMAVYELVMLCANPNHKVFGNNGETLIDANLMQSDGKVHNSIKNVVSSAITGEGLDMVLNSPRA